MQWSWTARTLALALALAGGGSAAHAQSLATAGGLAVLRLEQLSELPVTSVTGRPESLRSAPASVFVISGEDIRRSAATSLPEALRLAPQLQVARMSAGQYAISARGFNNAIANKLLVLIDGRTIYSSLFSGVFWDFHDLVLEDVDRIEVISGPGGTLWGANAVNGVINVITKSAAATQGTLVSATRSRAFAPDLVLLDIGLPGMSGYEVARATRAQPQLGGVVLVALTGWGAEDDRRRALEAGFDHHLTKPVDLKLLEDMLRRVNVEQRR